MVEPTPTRQHVVIGGGIMGLTIAYYLTKHHNQPVTLIENTALACSASGKSGGFLARDWQDHQPTEQLCRLSYDMHKKLADELDGAAKYDYRATNTYAVSVKQVTPNSTIAAKQQRPQSIKLPAWINGDVRSVRQIGTTDDTAQLTPYKFCQTLQGEIEHHNGRILIDTVAHMDIDTAQSQHSVKSVKLGSGNTIPCASVTVACGAWTSMFKSQLRTMPSITGNKAHSIILQPKDRTDADVQGVDNTMLFLDYTDVHRKSTDPEVYPRADGSIYICGSGDSTPLPATAAEAQSNDSAADGLYGVGCAVSSVIRDKYTVAVKQACYLPSAGDGAPVMGKLQPYSNVFVCTGHTCWGITNSAASGYGMAQLIVTGKSDVDLSEMSPDRFTSRKR